MRELEDQTRRQMLGFVDPAWRHGAVAVQRHADGLGLDRRLNRDKSGGRHQGNGSGKPDLDGLSPRTHLVDRRLVQTDAHLRNWIAVVVHGVHHVDRLDRVAWLHAQPAGHVTGRHVAECDQHRPRVRLDRRVRDRLGCRYQDRLTGSRRLRRHRDELDTGRPLGGQWLVVTRCQAGDVGNQSDTDEQREPAGHLPTSASRRPLRTSRELTSDSGSLTSCRNTISSSKMSTTTPSKSWSATRTM